MVQGAKSAETAAVPININIRTEDVDPVFQDYNSVALRPDPETMDQRKRVYKVRHYY